MIKVYYSLFNLPCTVFFFILWADFSCLVKSSCNVLLFPRIISLSFPFGQNMYTQTKCLGTKNDLVHNICTSPQKMKVQDNIKFFQFNFNICKFVIEWFNFNICKIVNRASALVYTSLHLFNYLRFQLKVRYVSRLTTIYK